MSSASGDLRSCIEALRAQLAEAQADAARANAQAGGLAEWRMVSEVMLEQSRAALASARAEAMEAIVHLGARADGLALMLVTARTETREAYEALGLMTLELAKVGKRAAEADLSRQEAEQCFDYAYNRLQECRAELATARGEPPPKLWSDAAAQTTDPKAPGYFVD